MDKEIERILKNTRRTIQFSPSRRYVELFNKEDMQTLLDYITNLQQENETLKAKLEIGKTCGFCPYYDYKSRCEKANELLQRHNEDTGDIYYKYNNRFVKSELKERLSEVLNGGDDK